MAEPQAFGYARGIAPLLWVFVGLAGVELVVDHLLLAHWSRAAALLLAGLTLASVAWLIAGIVSFGNRPVLLTDDALIWRLGTMKSFTIPRAQVAGLRASWDGAAVADRATLNLALIAYPNVLVDLAQPLRLRRRSVTALAHRLDDPAAFAAALAAWQAPVRA